MIRFAHTVFAMPFALIGFFLGIKAAGGFNWLLLLEVVLCMVFARNTAMGFNRWLDRDIDALNPRTKNREIPAGKISPGNAMIFIVINIILFIATTFFINRLVFYLSPIAIAVVMFYSYTKRFTPLCHFVLGCGLALAPIGAYLAVTGEFAVLPLVYSFMVLTWVSGFDIILCLLKILGINRHAGAEQVARRCPVITGLKDQMLLHRNRHLNSKAMKSGLGID